MSVSDDQIADVLDLFGGLGGLSTRKMMGGLCIYHDGVIFALLHSDGTVYLKGKGDMVAELEAAGAVHWVTPRDGKPPTAMPYWTLPDAALDDPDLACDWARRALAHL